MTSTTDTTQHPDVSEISDLTEGLLPPSRTADVRQHLDGCPLCADVRTSLEEIRGLLGTLPGAHRMPADVAGRIDAALAAEALLDATAPEETAHVSRETTPAPQQADATVLADRPAGRPRAATGPGRSRQSRRRRTAFLGAAFSAAAIGVSVLLLQSIQTTGSNDTNSAKKDAGVSALEGGGQEFSESSLKGRVQALLATSSDQAEPRIEKGPSIDSQSSPDSPRSTPEPAVPSCIQKGTGRADPPLAFEQGTYEGTHAYLVVLPHPTDSTRVQAYVIDAACVDTAATPTGKPLLKDTYPRR